MDNQQQIDRLIELAIVQRAELRTIVKQLPELRKHLEAEVRRAVNDSKPEVRAELERNFEAEARKIFERIELTTQARYNVIVAERAKNAELAKLAEQKITEAAAELPSKVKGVVEQELARFPRAGEIDKLRQEFATPKGLNPRGRWAQAIVYERLDLVAYNGDSYVANETTTERPSRAAKTWTLLAARGNGGGTAPLTNLAEIYGATQNGDLLIGNGTDFSKARLTAGSGIQITNGAGSITITNTGGDGGGGSASDTYNASSNASGNTTVSTTASRHLEVTNFSGSAGTRIVVMDIAGGPITGSIVTHRLNLPATASITVEIRNATSGGTLLYTLGTDGSGDDAVAETYFDGSAYQPLRFTYPAL